MDNIFNPGNQPQVQRPQLKKVKRPINRMMPQIPQSSVPDAAPRQESPAASPPAASPQTMPANNPFRQDTPQQPASTPETSGVSDAFDLDAYLDEDNLPATANLPENFQGNANPQFLNEEDFEQEAPSAFEVSKLPPYLTKKVLILLGAVLFFVGIVTGMLFFTDEKVVRNGLQGVVVNPEVPRGRARCGVAERTQGCVLYIMNPQRQELNARDFYDLASQLTGRQRFVIETGNMRYSNTKIRPGNIVQLNIPPL